MSNYTATIRWNRSGDGDFAKGQYSRVHEWSFDGGTVVPASASPDNVPPGTADEAGVDPEEAFAMMAQTGVRNTFIPPTALRMMRSAPDPRGRHAIRLRTVGSGGEALGAETYEWGKSALGLVINEFYGQTECNLVIGSCAAIGVSFVVRPCDVIVAAVGLDRALIHVLLDRVRSAEAANVERPQVESRIAVDDPVRYHPAGAAGCRDS